MNTIAVSQRVRRRAALIAASVVLAGCGGSSSNGSGNTLTAGASTSSPSAVAYSACMRSHDVPNFPDPSIDSQGRPVFAISISKLGFDPYSRQVWAKGNECSYLMPGLPGLPAAVSR